MDILTNCWAREHTVYLKVRGGARGVSPALLVACGVDGTGVRQVPGCTLAGGENDEWTVGRRHLSEGSMSELWSGSAPPDDVVAPVGSAYRHGVRTLREGALRSLSRTLRLGALADA